MQHSGETGRRPLVTRRYAAACMLAALTGCAREPDLAAGEEGRVARIQDGDALSLDTGLRVRLAEVEAPAKGFNDRQGEPYAEESEAMLAAAATGRRVRLYYGGLSRDRYGRAIAHAIASDEVGGDVWLNGVMARHGGARVRSFPDNSRRVARLYALEDEARTAKRGLWAADHYRVRSPDDLSGASGFVLIEGRLGASRTGPGGVDEFASAYFSGGEISLSDAGSLRALGDDAGHRPGDRIRIRGRIDLRGETPSMRLTHWAQIEKLD